MYCHNDTATEKPNCTPIGHYFPAKLIDKEIRLTEKIVAKAINALGIVDAVANIDLMLVDEEPYIIEIGARIGATCLPENIGYYLGCDVYECPALLDQPPPPTLARRLIK